MCRILILVRKYILIFYHSRPSPFYSVAAAGANCGSKEEKEEGDVRLDPSDNGKINSMKIYYLLQVARNLDVCVSVEI